MPKKTQKPPEEKAEEPVVEDGKYAPTELQVMCLRQQELLTLRVAMMNEGVDSISKLDVMLSRINQRIKELQ